MGVMNTRIVETAPDMDQEIGETHPFSLPGHLVDNPQDWMKEIRRRWRRDLAFKQRAWIIARDAQQHGEIEYRGPYAREAQQVIEGIRKNKT